MSSTRSFRIVLNRNEVDAYFKSLDKVKTQANVLNRTVEIASQKQKSDNREELNFEPLAMRTRQRIAKVNNGTNELASTQRELNQRTNRRVVKVDDETNDIVISTSREIKTPSIRLKSVRVIETFESNLRNEVTSTHQKRNKPVDSDESNSGPPAMRTRNRMAKVNNGTNEIASTQRELNQLDEIDESKAKQLAKRYRKDKTNDIPSSKVQQQRTNRQIKGMAKANWAKFKSNALMPALHQHQLVWAHIKGFPFWPGVLEQILPNGKFRIHFFGDYSRSDVTRRCILEYFEGFNQFECNFGNIRLKKAVEEAKYFLFGNNNSKECYVCKILECKTMYNIEKRQLK